MEEEQIPLLAGPSSRAFEQDDSNDVSVDLNIIFTYQIEQYWMNTNKILNCYCFVLLYELIKYYQNVLKFVKWPEADAINSWR